MELTRSQTREILFGLRVARNQVLVGAWDGYWNDVKRIDIGIRAIEEYERQRPRGRSHAKPAAQTESATTPKESETSDVYSRSERVESQAEQPTGGDVSGARKRPATWSLHEQSVASHRQQKPVHKGDLDGTVNG